MCREGAQAQHDRNDRNIMEILQHGVYVHTARNTLPQLELLERYETTGIPLKELTHLNVAQVAPLAQTLDSLEGQRETQTLGVRH